MRKRIPAPVRVADVARLPVAALHRIQEQAPQVGQFHLRLQIGDRPADIGGDQVQHRFDRAGKAADAKIAPDHHQGDADALQQIGQVPVDLAEFHVADLQLFVQRVQFFVGGFQFLLSGFQLLIAGLRLFGGRPELLHGRCILFDDRLQILFSGQQLAPQPGAYHLVRHRGLARRLPAPRLGSASSNRTRKWLPLVEDGSIARDNLDADVPQPAVLLDPEAAFPGRGVGFPSGPQRLANACDHALARQVSEGYFVGSPGEISR